MSSFVYVLRVHSYKCRCVQKPITCTPVDGWHVVLSCDASNAVTPVSCTYTKSIGSSYSQSVNESMSLDTSIETELKVQYFGLFSSQLSTSVETGYDWNHVSTEAMSEEVSIEVIFLL